MINHIQAGLYLSGREALNELKKVREENIKAVLRLDHALSAVHQWPEEFSLLHMPIYDGEPVPRGTFGQATTFIHHHLNAKRNVLVHCQVGVSRSVTMVLAYLIEYEKMDLATAFRLVKSKRSIAYPHPALLHSLVEHYDLPFSSSQVSSLRFLDHLLKE